MSQNDVSPLSNAVAPMQQIQIDSLPIAAQPLVPLTQMLAARVLQLPVSLAEQPNYTTAFAPLQTTHVNVEEVDLQNPQQTSTSVKGSGVFGLLGVCNLFGRHSDNHRDAVEHRNDVAKECKLAEINLRREVSKDNLELQKHRDSLTAELVKNQQASAVAWAANNTQMVCSAMNHQQNVISALATHVQSVKQMQANLEEQKIRLDHELEMAKIKLENLNESNTLKRLQPKKKHGAGRDRGRNRH